MASITFPSSPNPGDTVTDPNTGSIWLWDGTKWTFQPGSGSGGGQSPIVFGPTPPTPPAQGMVWWNTDVSKLYVYDGAQWVVVVNTPGGEGGSGAFLPLTGGTVTGDTTIHGNSFLDAVVIPLQTAGSNIGQLSFNSIHAGGTWSYQADGAAGVIQVGANNALSFYAAPVGTAGAEFSDWVGVLAMSPTQASFGVPLSMPAFTSGDSQVNTILFGYYGTGQHWSFNYVAGYNGASGPAVLSNINGSEFPLVVGFDQSGSWWPWTNVAIAGGGTLAQANIAFAGPEYFINWATNSSSDRRLKSNIGDPTVDAMTMVQSLKVHQADMRQPRPDGKVDQLHYDFCFIADEVEPLVPQAVCKHPEPEKGYDILNPLHLVPVLWKAVQDLSAKVAALEAASGN